MNYDTILQNIEEHIEETYKVLNQTHNLTVQEKQKQLNSRVKDILSKLQDLNQQNQKEDESNGGFFELSKLSLEQKARIYYLKGKALEVFQEYNKDAEEALSKAVKLNPNLMDAWNVLGHCFWKKNDLISAKNCYSTALSLSRNKTSLRELSRVLRLLDPKLQLTQEEKQFSGITLQQLLNRKRVDNLIESISKAKEAVQLDFSDGESWYILGNAYLSSYILHSLDVADLNKALSAFKQAEKSETTAQNPDLHYNRSIIYKHLERYQEAYEGFKKALELDPSLIQASSQMDEIVTLVNKCATMIDEKGKLKPKDIQRILSKFPPATQIPSQLKDVPLSQLQCNGQSNKGLLLTVRVLSLLSSTTSVPLVFLAIDREGAFCTLSTYNVHSTAIKENDLLSIPEPVYETIHLDLPILFKSNENEQTARNIKRYNTIRVTVPLQLLLNRQRIPDSCLISPSLAIQTFSN